MLSIETPDTPASRSSNEEQVYDALRNAARSMSAYEILGALRDTNIKAAVQVYRALERLIAKNRVHRIESLNAFVACRCEAHSTLAGFDHGEFDPHAWQSVENEQIYVRNIADALCGVDQSKCSEFRANAEGYTKELASLHATIKIAVGALPEDRRTVITSHDAFGYFSHAYGITFLAPEGVSTESEASAKDVARLIEQIREDKASALFVENISDPRLIEQISRETGRKIRGALYSDALSAKDGPAPSYVEMMQYNTRLLTAAMTGS